MYADFRKSTGVPDDAAVVTIAWAHASDDAAMSVFGRIRMEVADGPVETRRISVCR